MKPEPAVRDELMTLLRYANKSAVAAALGLTPQAVINWSEGRNVSEGRLEQVRALFGLETKEAPPAEADGAVPAWAQDLVTRTEIAGMIDAAEQRVIDQLKENRGAFAVALGREVARLLGEDLERTQRQLLDELARANGRPEE